MVSSKWKYNGAKITRDPFRKYIIPIKCELWSCKNCVSSLPKWYEATSRNIINKIDGIKIQSVTTITANKIYEI